MIILIVSVKACVWRSYCYLLLLCYIFRGEHHYSAWLCSCRLQSNRMWLNTSNLYKTFVYLTFNIQLRASNIPCWDWCQGFDFCMLSIKINEMFHVFMLQLDVAHQWPIWGFCTTWLLMNPEVVFLVAFGQRGETNHSWGERNGPSQAIVYKPFRR